MNELATSAATRSGPPSLPTILIEPTRRSALSGETDDSLLSDLVTLGRTLAPNASAGGQPPALLVRCPERWRPAAVSERLRALARAVGLADAPRVIALDEAVGARGLRAAVEPATRARPESAAAVLWFPPTPAALVAALDGPRSLIAVARAQDELLARRLIEVACRDRAERVRLQPMPGTVRAPPLDAYERTLSELIDVVVVAARSGARVVHYPMAGPDYLGLDHAPTSVEVSPAGVVRELSALLASLDIPLTIDNPCADMTTEEILRTLVARGAAGGLEHTISCVDPGARAARHCGRCAACFERRAAVLNLGLEAHDPIAGYTIDPFTGARPRDGARLLDALRRLDVAADPSDRPERELVLAWSSAAAKLPGEFAANLDHVVRLYRRRARELSRALDQALSLHARALRRGELARGCLLVDAVLGAYRDREEGAPSRLVLRRVGDLWEACFGGSGPTYLPSARGLEYLRELLVRPHVSLSAVELRDLRAGVRSSATADVATPTADREALSAYRRRLHALCELRRAAEADGDLGRTARIDAETTHLERELDRARGLGGRPRSTGDAERARKAISNAIRASIALLRRHLPDMAAHLEATIRTGGRLCYEPPHPIAWE